MKQTQQKLIFFKKLTHLTDNNLLESFSLSVTANGPEGSEL
jgi:hypothetical protein